jgi:hypothetical protein
MWKETNIIEAHTLQIMFWSKWDHMVRIYDLGPLHVCLEKGLMVIEMKFLC